MTAAVEMMGVTKLYGAAEAVRDVSFALPRERWRSSVITAPARRPL